MEGRLIEYRPIGGGLDYHHNSPLIGEIPNGEYSHVVHRSIDQLRNSLNERVALGPLSVFSSTDLRNSVLAYNGNAVHSNSNPIPNNGEDRLQYIHGNNGPISSNIDQKNPCIIDNAKGLVTAGGNNIPGGILPSSPNNLLNNNNTNNSGVNVVPSSSISAPHIIKTERTHTSRKSRTSYNHHHNHHHNNHNGSPSASSQDANGENNGHTKESKVGT